MIDTQPVTEYLFETDNPAPFNTNFEVFGYGNMYVVANLGSLLYIMMLSPLFIVGLFLVSYMQSCLCSGSQARILKSANNMKDNLIFGGILEFMSQTYLMILVAATLNVKKSFDGETNYNMSFYIACILLALFAFYMLWNICIFTGINKKKRDATFKKRYGSHYQKVDTKRLGCCGVFFYLILAVRELLLALVLIMMDNVMMQLTSLILFSMAIMVIVGGVEFLNRSHL